MFFMKQFSNEARCCANDWSKVASGGATAESVLKRPNKLYYFEMCGARISTNFLGGLILLITPLKTLKSIAKSPHL